MSAKDSRSIVKTFRRLCEIPLGTELNFGTTTSEGNKLATFNATFTHDLEKISLVPEKTSQDVLKLFDTPSRTKISSRKPQRVCCPARRRNFANNRNNLDEQTVLKTILLFQAIDQESRGEVDIFRPTEKNLELAFTGVAYMENIRTAELVDNANLIGKIKLTPAQKFRYDLRPVTADTLFLSTNLRKLSEAGIEQTEYSMLKANSIKIVLGDVWQMSGKYWKVYPDLSISRLKIELDALIKSELVKNVHISFDDVFSYLLERGFMPLNIYAFLTGFLLKEYAGDPYRFSAGLYGNSGGAMSVPKLAEFIGESIKQSLSPARNYHPKYLEIMSQNQRQFMLFASEIFGVVEDVSVEQSAQKLRLRLKNFPDAVKYLTDNTAEERRAMIEAVQGKQTIPAAHSRRGKKF